MQQQHISRKAENCKEAVVNVGASRGVRDCLVSISHPHVSRDRTARSPCLSIVKDKSRCREPHAAGQSAQAQAAEAFTCRSSFLLEPERASGAVLTCSGRSWRFREGVSCQAYISAFSFPGYLINTCTVLAVVLLGKNKTPSPCHPHGQSRWGS